MRFLIRLLSVVTALAQLFAGMFVMPVYGKIEDCFSSQTKLSYCTGYSELRGNKTNSTEDWRQGMVSGNGLQGVITSSAPYSDTLIYQNMHFIMPNKNVRYCPDTASELETVRQSIVAGKDITDTASYDDVYSFHPGAALRINQKKHIKTEYARWTDYETAQVGVRYTDINGSWQRTTFTSQADNATITQLGSSSNGTKINLTLSIDDISAFANYGSGSEVDIRYKKLVGDGCEYIAFAAHYPSYENSELKNGGYATLVYVVCEGGTKEKVSGEPVQDAQYAGEDNPQIKISNADAVYLLAVSERTHNMGEYSEFDAAQSYPLVNSLADTARTVAEKYTQNGRFDYSAALAAHTAIFTPIFNAVTLTLGEASTESNEKTVARCKLSGKTTAALAQRAYYSGRYAYLCCSGYSTSRLYGMWTGEWAPGWGSKYTMDANVNLQTSSVNTGNISLSPVGYACFILRQVPDWEENAMATHGYSDCIQAPVNSDGDKAVITETCYPYPFRYWNAGASWLLEPLYETLQCYGDISIPLNGEYDLASLKSVLSMSSDDLSETQLAELEGRGALDLRSEILLPLLLKSANYWDCLMTPEYYTDASGSIHYESGKTQLEAGEKYAILPSYSPENNPANYPSPSTANCAVDIAACKNNLEMLIDIMKSIYPDADTAHWQALLTAVPDYTFDETGALKEWSCNEFDENNLHRHLSHLYCAWPLFETQGNAQLTAACKQAIANRNSENEASHALVHRALIAARLKDAASVTEALGSLMSNGIYYDSLMTNHDYDRNSCYCTDFAIGYLGIVNESLVYSNTGEIEILPALPQNGFDCGTVTGLRARTRAQITDLSWSLADGTATVTVKSDIDQSIKLSCGLSEKTQTVQLSAGESITVSFDIA